MLCLTKKIMYESTGAQRQGSKGGFCRLLARALILTQLFTGPGYIPSPPGPGRHVKQPMVLVLPELGSSCLPSGSCSQVHLASI